jgi:hypothetical protein
MFVFLAIFSLCSPVFAASGSIGASASVVAADDIGFRLEAPPKASDKPLQVKVEATDYKKITPVDDFYLSRSVEVTMVNNSGWSAGFLARPVRLVFSFNDIDYKRASNLNTNLPVGRFRIGFWDESKSNWVQLPSQVFWNGSEGAVEAETDRGPGRYALLWSLRDDAQLSPAAPEGIRILVNLAPVRSEVAPYVKDDRTMVPLRVVAENLGARVDWNSSENRVDLVRNLEKVSLWIGKAEALKGGQPVTFDVSPEVTDGRTFVPLRFVAEALGARVEWDDVTQTARVFSN